MWNYRSWTLDEFCLSCHSKFHGEHSVLHSQVFHYRKMLNAKLCVFLPLPKWKRCILFWFLTQIYWTCFSIIFFLFCERLCYSFDTLYADWLFQSQEPGKTKHPQLHYESKLYMLLQGGSECLSLTPPKKILYYNYQFLTLPICKTVFVIIHNSLPLNKPYNW